MTKFKNRIIKAAAAVVAACLVAVGSMSALAIEVDYELVSIAGGFIRVNRYTGVLQGSTENISGDLIIPSEASGVKITSIADSAFYGREAITSVTIPAGITSIGDQAFASCLSLKTVKISEGVTSMGKDVFRYCYSLTDVSLPTTLNAINDNAFYKCIALENITVPNGVNRIGTYAFAECDKLKSVSLPSTVTSIGDYCFSNCVKLSSITLPSGLATVPTAVLSGCTSLEKLVVADGVQSISGLAFRGCSNLKSISLPDSISSIIASAFDGCGNVTFYVNAGSYSQAFAAANKIPFVLGTLDGGVSNTPVNPGDTSGNYAETPFSDVKNHWAKSSIEWAYAMGYFKGATATTFAPEKYLDRAMMVSVLYRAEGSPSVGKATFSDVKSSDYFANAAAWGQSTGIVDGTSATKFSPTLNITREQLATMLYRYAQYKGMDVSARGDLSKFKDTSKISDYAGTAMSWAVGAGIMDGMSSARLEPRGNATRAQATVMLQRFENLK